MTTFCTPLNNVSTTLGAAYTSGGTSLVVASGQGALFGSPTPSAPVRVTVVALSALDSSGRITDRTKVAVFKATGRTSDTLTGLTLDEGTDQNFAINDVVAVVNTAKTESDQHTAINALETTVATLAVDSTVVHNTGTETVAGAKTFSTAPVLASLTGILKASTGVLSAAVSGTDYVAPTGSGAGLTSLNASALGSGTVPTARLGSGTANNTTYLRGDSTWVTISSGMTVGNPVSGGAANRVLFEDGSQNLATASGFNYSSSTLTAQTIKATAGMRVDGSVNSYNGGELYFDGVLNTAAVTTAYTGSCLMLFAHRGTSNTGSFSFRNGTNGGTTLATIDSTGNLTLAGGLNQTGIMNLTAGMDVQGGPVGYGGGEIRFSSAFYPGNAIYTTYTGSPTIYFDHRGTGNTGTFNWRNGTGGGTTLMTLSSAGLLTTAGGHVPASTSGAPGSAGATGEIRVDPTNNKIWMYNGSAWKSVLLS